MSFSLRNLRVVAEAPRPDTSKDGPNYGVKKAFYVTDDDAATVEGSDYFGDAVDQGYLHLNDIIEAVVDYDGTPAFKIYRISDDTAGSVEVTAASDGTNDITA